MNVGEKIFSNNTKQTYTVFQTLKAGGQSEVCFATSDKSKKIFFIKRFLSVKYSEKPKFKLKCHKFEEERHNIYNLINSNTLPGGSCSYIYDFFRENTFYYVVTEKIEGFELCPLQLAESMPIEDRLFLFRIIVYSFLPFESNKIVHGDIKPENIFIEYVDNYPIARIIDFESSFFAENPPPQGYIVGTEPYYSPELAKYNSEASADSNVTITTKSDIFSLGLVLFEILTGHYPTAPKNEYWYEACNRGEQLSVDKSWSRELELLVQAMLSHSPEKRPTILQILSSLKKIEDVSTGSLKISSPIIKVDRNEPDKALIRLYNICKHTKLYYSCNNSEYSEYTKPFNIYSDDTIVKFKLYSLIDNKETYFKSTINVSEHRHSKCKRPQIKIISGIVHITSDSEKSEIFYTLDGTLPTVESNRYVAPFEVNENITIKAIARQIGFYASDPAIINSSSKIKIS